MSDLLLDLWPLPSENLSLRWVLTLLHFLWQGCVIGLAVFVVGSMLRDASASVRYWLYSLALVSLPICVALTFLCIRVSSGVQFAPPSIQIEMADESKATLPNGVAQANVLPAMPHQGIVPSPTTAQMNQHQSMNGNASSIDSVQPESSAESTAEAIFHWLSPLAPWAFIAYAVGVACFVMRFIAALWGGKRLRADSTPLVDSALLERVRANAKQIGLQFVPVIAYAERVTVPLVIGILRPMILLPTSIMTGLSPDEFDTILSHELAHIRRYDLWMNLLQRSIESLLFFHPVVWWLSRRVSAEREVCCDDLVVSAGHSPIRYAGALVRMAELCLDARQPSLASLAAGGRTSAELERRIDRLMQLGRRTKLPLNRSGLLILIVLLVALVSMPVLLSALVSPNNSSQVVGKYRNDQLTQEQNKEKPSFEMRFDVVNADNGLRVSDVAILYKEDEATWFGDESDYETWAHWIPFQIIENGKPTFQAPTLPIMGQADVMIAAKGFELVELKLNEVLPPGQPVVKQVSVKAIPPVEFALKTATGVPAANATVEALHSKELKAIRNCDGDAQLKEFLKIAVQSDAQGIVRFPWPALSNWTTYRFEHPAGYVDVPGRNLPIATRDRTGDARTISLLAYSGVKVTYLPEIRENEFLEFVRLDSSRNAVASEAKVVTVEPNGQFELTQLMQGWYSFVHRVRYTDVEGREHYLSIGGYGPFELANAPMREVTLGTEGRSVVGRLMVPERADLKLDTLTIAVSSKDITHTNPIEPKGLDEESSKTWWDAYWDSAEGRQYRESGRRSFTTAIDVNGRFHFPNLPPGKYRLRAGRHVGHSDLVLRPVHEFEIPAGTTTDTFDLGDVVINLVKTGSF